MTTVRETPLYRQVATRIEGSLGASPAAGHRLPSERTLCAQFGVSRVTLRAALALLADEGVITSAAARGWFVADPDQRPNLPARTGRVTGFSDSAAARGQSSSAVVLEAATRPCTLDEADVFEIVPGSPIFELRRLRRVADLVIAADHSRVPLSVCPSVVEHDFSTASLYQVLRTAPDPVQPTIAEYAVEAVTATDEQAQLLEMPPGTPLLVARQQTRDQHGRVFEIGQTNYRGDRYRFRATLGIGGP